MKIDIERFAKSIAEFGGLATGQHEGLTLFLRIVEHEAFADGVRAGRLSSFAKDASLMADDYSAMRIGTTITDRSLSQALAQPPSVDAVDPQACSTGTPSTRDGGSSS